MNNYNTFTAPDGTKWLVLSMEFGPRDDVLRWAGEVLDAHLDHRVIIVSHSLTNYASRHDPAGGPPMVRRPMSATASTATRSSRAW
ncbi:MAG: hypothetical protein B7Z53_00710 [Rhodospirillales bacterium 12-71-4]|nr:MAG: hypothetical protein B7Z53_00710 [Rhodospirillales bacterium 12-71-4]